MTTAETEKPKKQRKGTFDGLGAVIAGFVVTFIVVVIIALLVRAFIVQAFQIPSSSMEPTLLKGDHILVDKNVYGFKIPFTQERFPQNLNPQRGHVIVFLYPEDRTKAFVGRVIAVGGDTVESRNKHIFVNGNEVVIPQARTLSNLVFPGDRSPRDNFGPITVPKDHLFVMGDNRDYSQDSRFRGFVPVQDVIGKVSKIYLSVAESGKVRWNRLFKPIH